MRKQTDIKIKIEKIDCKEREERSTRDVEIEKERNKDRERVPV